MVLPSLLGYHLSFREVKGDMPIFWVASTMVIDDRGVLHFNKGWSMVSVQNNCLSNRKALQSSVKAWRRCMLPNRCMWPPQEKKTVDTSHGCSEVVLEPTRIQSEPHLLNMGATFDLSEIEKMMPQQLGSRAGDNLLQPRWCLLSVYSSFGQSIPKSRFCEDP